jgi:hypothetical protein
LPVTCWCKARSLVDDPSARNESCANTVFIFSV